MIIKYNHITKKRLILLVILMALILMPSIKSYAASTTNTTINKNNDEETIRYHIAFNSSCILSTSSGCNRNNSCQPGNTENQ